MINQITSGNNKLLDLNAISTYITSDLLSDPTLIIKAEQDLLISGLLDSLNVIKLTDFVAEKARITIPPEDILLENFGSLQMIDDYLITRQQGTC